MPEICYCDREMWHMHNDDLVHDYDYAGPKGPNALIWIGSLYLTYGKERNAHTHEQAWKKALTAFCANCFEKCGTDTIYDLPLEWEDELRYIKHSIMLTETDSY